ncbi:MAG: ABC-F family ATP-binding cassette domain-containing protein [Lachnospiraceae bacterium]|jgi:ATP-binding cassette subfamily F protein 3|nr:ABC-F family ATP-binding cassette domain-containing protein [Lachnospiraceae bacterium]
MMLNCHNLSIAFSGKEIFQNVGFHIEDTEKVALVGINGAGKTTLIRILVGEQSAQDGSVIFAKGKSVGYLPQNASLQSTNTVFEELLQTKQDLLDLENRIREYELLMKSESGDQLEARMSAYAQMTHEYEQKDGYTYRSEVVGVLKGLGFDEEDFPKSCATLSGGQKTRVALGKLLLLAPDFIILDEPTNHLDMNSIAWLETYLMNYKGALLLVSHDRYFLNRVVNKVIELEQGKATSYLGNYTDFATKKQQLRDAAIRAYENQQKELRRQEEIITKLRSFNREKSIRRAESREKMVEKIEVLERPSQARTDIHLTLKPRISSGNDVLSIRGLSKSFDTLSLFTDVDLDIKRGEHVAIIGDNGTGKTTLLKILNGLVAPDTGQVVLGSKVEIGYYDQEHNVLHSEKSLFDEISDEYPELTNTQIRNILAAFLFTQDDVFQLISTLSGGERGRVSLAKLMLGYANFLILDEPTNHLDITSKEILENALNHYEGTVLFVSHDRYFINRTAHRILELREGQFHNYLGNYDYYLEKRPPILPKGSQDSRDATVLTQTKREWLTQKESIAKRRKQENDLKKCENEIAQLESHKSTLTEEMNDPTVAADFQRLTALSADLHDTQQSLDHLYTQWEELYNSSYS